MTRKMAGAAAALIGAVMIVLGSADLAAAGTQTFSGALAPGDTTWDRPYCDGSLEGSIEFYDQQTFHVTVDGNYDITMPVMTGTISPDGYFLLYEESFDATSPATNCIAEDDDGGAGSLDPAILGIPLVANTNYVLVTTQCCDGTSADEGIAYTNDITGPGEIVLGPFQVATTTTTPTTTPTTAGTTAPSTATTAVVAPSTTARVLARTGSSNGQLSLFGVVLVAGGIGVLVAARRRTQFSAATST